MWGAFNSTVKGHLNIWKERKTADWFNSKEDDTCVFYISMKDWRWVIICADSALQEKNVRMDSTVSVGVNITQFIPFSHSYSFQFMHMGLVS